MISLGKIRSGSGDSKITPNYIPEFIDSYGNTSETGLTKGVFQWAGLYSVDPQVTIGEIEPGEPLPEEHLSTLNDEGASFREIADLIEQSL